MADGYLVIPTGSGKLRRVRSTWENTGVNLLTDAESDFEDGTTAGWMDQGNANTRTNSSTVAATGTKSLRAANTSVAGNLIVRSPLVPYTLGDWAYGRLSVRSSVVRNSNIGIYFYTSDGTFVGNINYPTPPAPTLTTAWVTNHVFARPDPIVFNTIAQMSVGALVQAAGVGEFHYFDDAHLEYTEEVYTPQPVLAPLPSFTMFTPAGTQGATNRVMWGVWNGSTEPIRLRKLFVWPVGTAAVAGIQVEFRLTRTSTTHSGGTVATLNPADTADTLPSGITANYYTGSTITPGTTESDLYSFFQNNDEQLPSGTSGTQNWLQMANNAPEGIEQKETTILPGQGLVLTHVTNTTVTTVWHSLATFSIGS